MKLYWRVKHNGKWTWRPAQVTESGRYTIYVKPYTPQEGEEE